MRSACCRRPTKPARSSPIRSPDKRARLIDDLLARPEFAEHWALKWADLLRNEEKVLDAKGVDAVLRLDSRLDRRRQAAGPVRPRAGRRPAAARTTIRRPISIGPIATRSPAAKRRPGCSSACGCNVPAATTIRTTAGRRTTITTGPPCSAGSTTRSWRTSAATGSTSTSSTASRSC